MSFDLNKLSTLDRVIAGGALVAFIAAFLPWYGASVGPFSASVSGWSAGFSAWAGALLLTAAGVIVVLRRSGAAMPSTGSVGPAVLVAGVAGVGLLLVIIRWVSFPSVHAAGLSYNVGARYGIFLALIAGIAEVAASVMEMRASGERMPWAQAQGASPEPESPPEAPAAPEE
jgi:hypothetical protein